MTVAPVDHQDLVDHYLRRAVFAYRRAEENPPRSNIHHGALGAAEAFASAAAYAVQAATGHMPPTGTLWRHWLDTLGQPGAGVDIVHSMHGLSNPRAATGHAAALLIQEAGWEAHARHRPDLYRDRAPV